MTSRDLPRSRPHLTRASRLHLTRNLAASPPQEDGASELLASLTASPNIDYTDLRGNRIPDPSPTIRPFC